MLIISPPVCLQGLETRHRPTPTPTGLSPVTAIEFLSRVTLPEQILRLQNSSGGLNEVEISSWKANQSKSRPSLLEDNGAEAVAFNPIHSTSAKRESTILSKAVAFL